MGSQIGLHLEKSKPSFLGSHGFRWQSNRGHLSKHQKWPILKDWEMALRNPRGFVVSSSKHLHPRNVRLTPTLPKKLVFTIRPALLFNNHLQMHSTLHLRWQRFFLWGLLTLSPSNGFMMFHASFHKALANVESSTSPGKTKVGVQLWSPQRIKWDFFLANVGYFLRGVDDASNHQVTFKFQDCY